MSRSSVPEPPSFRPGCGPAARGNAAYARSSGHQSGQLRAGEQRLVQLIARFNEYPAAVALHRHQRDTGPAQCVDVALDGAARHLKPLRQRGHGAFSVCSRIVTMPMRRSIFIELSSKSARRAEGLSSAPSRRGSFFKDLRASAQRAHLAVQLFVHAGAHPFLGGGLHGFVQHEPAHAAVLVGLCPQRVSLRRLPADRLRSDADDTAHICRAFRAPSTQRGLQ